MFSLDWGDWGRKSTKLQIEFTKTQKLLIISGKRGKNVHLSLHYIVICKYLINTSSL